MSARIGFAGEIHNAAHKGDLKAIERLSSHGADLNELAASGDTALITSILAGHSAVARLLIERGADIHARNLGGFTPLHAAAYSGRTDLLPLLISNSTDINDQKNKAGVSPLTVAAEEGQFEAVKRLIELGADLEAAEQNGYTALTRALWRGHSAVVAELQSSGAKCQPVEVLEEPTFSVCMANQRQ